MIVLARRQVHPLAVVLLVLQLLDLATTALVIQLGGGENNRVVTSLGWETSIALKCGYMLLVAVLSLSATPFVVRCLKLCCALYAVVVCWNLLVAGALV